MTVLILILGQLLLIAFGLKIIFLLIDKAILFYRKKTYHPDRFRLMEETETLKRRRARDRKNENLARIQRKSLTSPGLSGSWHQLLIRVQFDIPTAERLINGLRLRHPGKSDRWLIEKAIHDLERDRR